MANEHLCGLSRLTAFEVFTDIRNLTHMCLLHSTQYVHTM
jgi:hypothetical protein